MHIKSANYHFVLSNLRKERKPASFLALELASGRNLMDFYTFYNLTFKCQTSGPLELEPGAKVALF